MKVSSRNVLDILRRYEIANSDNVPRNVESVKISHPKPINTLVSFIFLRNKYFILFDDTADDGVDYIKTQIKSIKNNTIGELIINPNDNKTYAMPYKGKECYLFIAISNKKRLDSEITSRYPENSRSSWQKYIKAGYVSVNGKVITSPKHDISENDEIAINLPDNPDFSKNIIPIIYIDDNIIAVNKPSGILSHTKGVLSEEFTVAEFFRNYTTYNLDSNRPGIIHRLDRDTSGIMIGARNPETAKILQKQFADRKVKKIYYAILDGKPKLQTANIELPIERNPSTPSTFRVGINGKPATTKYEVLDSSDEYSYVKLIPKTGRTHQLRVHMKYLNTPILGDRVYGKQSDRLFLHAYSLEITIPTGNRKIFTAPIPNEFNKRFPDMKL